MFVYLGFIIIILVQWLILFPNWKINLSKSISYRQKKMFMVLICVELICFAGIRSTNIGADTGTYIKALEYYSGLVHDDILKAKLIWPFDFEIGYFYLTKLSAWLSLNATEFLFVIACIIYIPICMFIFRYSDNPMISVLTYFAFGYFGYSLGIFRQMIALSIVLLGYTYIQKRKLLKYIIVIGIAMLFHTTAIIMLPFYWLSQIKIKNKLKWIFIFEALFFLVARVIVLLSVRLMSKYAGYVSGKYDVQGGSYIMLILLNIILVAGYYILNKETNKENKILQMSVNAIVLAIFLQILGYSMGIFGRIVPYYSIYLIILIPVIVNQTLSKNRILIHFSSVIILILVFYISTRNSVLIPYSTIFAAKGIL